jgi:RNA polymerase sigma factor (sigma-70 family)
VGDAGLVEQMQRGNELAFEAVFERHGGAILSFCRHMLGSAEEAEDAVQQTFASAWSSLAAGEDRAIVLKPWLFTIARNRCISMLRQRREQAELPELATAGLPDEVERRAELRELLGDIGRLPAEQREALLLTEVGDLSHPEVAGVLGCAVPRVKSLVFRARSSLIARRAARATPCEEIREQLANLRGGALRRNELRLHLSDCPGCSAYAEEVKRQRQLLAAALPVTPPSGLELSVLAAAGIGGSGAAMGSAAAGGAAAAGIGASLGSAGSALLAKIAVVGVLAGGGAVAGSVLVDKADPPRQALPAEAPKRIADPDRSTPGDGRAAAARRAAGSPSLSRAGDRRPDQVRRRDELRSSPARPGAAAPGRETSAGRGRKLGHEKRGGRGRRAEVPARTSPGRGPVDNPAGPGRVRRGPATPPPAPAAKPQAAPRPKPQPAPAPAAPGLEAQMTVPAAPVVPANGKDKAPKP